MKKITDDIYVRKEEVLAVETWEIDVDGKLQTVIWFKAGKVSVTVPGMRASQVMKILDGVAPPNEGVTV